MKIANFISILRNMGLRYTVYRVRHELEKRMGLLVKRFPVNPPEQFFITLENWQKLNVDFMFGPEGPKNLPKNPQSELEAKVQAIKSGTITFFSAKDYFLGRDYDWITNPETGYRYPNDIHWSFIADYDKSKGDIKYVWEKSRFGYLQDIIRHDFHFERDSAAFVFAELDSWIAANPINCGPNYRCSQEMSLRLMNWSFALFFYKRSPELSEERWKSYQNVIYWHLHHIYYHIDFSRIAVRNNHAITETAMLALSELLFPFIPETKYWASKGRKYLEEEIAYQIYDDGTYLQFSMNYHRVVVQVLSLTLGLTELHKKPLSQLCYSKAYKSLKFLMTCMQRENGQLPNYGANDGALFFKFSSTKYRDYRPQLNTLHKVLTGKSLTEGVCGEEAYWLIPEDCSSPLPPIVIENGIHCFEEGGYYVIRDTDSFSFIRCGSHKDRPSQADNLHLDIWKEGENLLRDAGSYKYNTDEANLSYFMGTKGHNSLMINQRDQMLKGSRFIWHHWSQCTAARLIENDEEYVFEGEIKAFGHLSRKIRHKRIVKKKKGVSEWAVVDQVAGINGETLIEQVWHPYSSDRFQIDLYQDEDTERMNLEGWYSSFYGKKERTDDLIFRKKDHQINATISITTK